MLNLPNILTLARIGMVPFIVALMHAAGPAASAAAAILFAVAALTDLVDGHLARSRGQVTTLGKFLDPLADKLLIVSVLVMLVALGNAPAWAVIIIIARELAVTGLRGIAAEGGMVIAADRFGKLKTVTQSVALFFLVLHHDAIGFDPQIPGMALFYVALVLTVFSGGKYVYGFLKTVVKTG